MNILVFAFILNIGYCPGVAPLYENAIIESSLPFYTDLQAELVLFDFFFVGGGTRTNFSFVEFQHGFPFSAYYNFKAGIRIGEYIEIGWSHVCLHAVLSSSEPARGLDMDSYNEFYVKIKGKINLF